MQARMRQLALLCVAGVVLAAFGSIACRDLHGLTLVVRAGDRHGSVRRLADFDCVPIDERIVSVPVRGASIRAGVFAPRGAPRQTILLVPGLHADGIDEPRLVIFRGAWPRPSSLSSRRKSLNSRASKSRAPDRPD